MMQRLLIWWQRRQLVVACRQPGGINPRFVCRNGRLAPFLSLEDMLHDRD